MSLITAYVNTALLITTFESGVVDSANVGINGGALTALESPENRQYFELGKSANQNGTGHTREVRVASKQRLTKSDNPDLEMDGCDFPGEMPYIEETVAIDMQSAEGFRIEEATLQLYPELVTRLETITGAKTARQMFEIGRTTREGQQIISTIYELGLNLRLAFDSLIQKINVNLVTDLAAKKGTWQGGDASKSYVVQEAEAYASGGGSLRAGGLFKFKQDYRKTMFGRTPHVIAGYGALERIMAQDGRYFGQGANGVNYGSVRANADQVMRMFVDENIVDVLGDEDAALIFTPGNAVFLPSNKYVGPFGPIGTMERFTLPIPIIPSVDVDVKVLPNECSEYYEFKMGLHYGTYVPQMDLFKSTDRLSGINGVFQAEFTQATP